MPFSKALNPHLRQRPAAVVPLPQVKGGGGGRGEEMFEHSPSEKTGGEKMDGVLVAAATQRQALWADVRRGRVQALNAFT